MKATGRQIKLLRGILFEDINSMRNEAFQTNETIEQTETFLKEYSGIEYKSKKELDGMQIAEIIEKCYEYALNEFGIELEKNGDIDDMIDLNFDR